MLRTLAATTALLVAGTVLPAAGAGAAEPAERRLSPVVSIEGSEGEVTLLACMEPARVGRGWRVFLAVDNSEGTAAASGRVVARRSGETVARWSSGRVSAGRVSRTTSVRIPRRVDSVESRVSSGGSTGGGGGSAVDFPRC